MYMYVLGLEWILSFTPFTIMVGYPDNFMTCLLKNIQMFIQAALVFLQIMGKTEQDTYQLPFYCNFDFTCLVSAHAQTLNEYPDTKKQIRIFSSLIIIWIIGYPFQP